MTFKNFPGGPVVKTPCSQCQGPGFNPWLENQIPCATTNSSHATTKDWKIPLAQLRLSEAKWINKYQEKKKKENDSTHFYGLDLSKQPDRAHSTTFSSSNSDNFTGNVNVSLCMHAIF